MRDEQEPRTVFDVPGLSAPVEVLIDRWGVPHLYASSRRDLFLAQGFNAARDRLFQIDLWRRRGLGLLSEVFGRAYLEHDRAARLFLYRGDMKEEWRAYGPGTEERTKAFTDGVNAFVTLCRRERSLLPPEFALLGYEPSLWDAADVARIRSHGLYYNLNEEVSRALTLRDFGAEVEDLRRVREPGPHRIRVPDGLDLTVIPDDVLRVYRLATVPPWAAPSPGGLPAPSRTGLDGSNNWVIGGSRTATGRPLLANDPHRAVTLPSLRYLSHLSAPGLDVIGAGEPALPGISIGHNGKIAFGLTIFPIDQEDLYVYRTDPADRTRYRSGEGWESMVRVEETVPVAGGEDAEVELWFTRHGPVIREHPDRDAAFAVRAAWLEPGMAPYLGSMDYMGAQDADEFTAAMRRWGAPGENQVYAAADGTIGWSPAGRVPIRRGWDGTLPVPGDGRYEWEGHLDAEELPSERDPRQGWFATANEMNLPPSHYDGTDSKPPVTYDWYAPYRHRRIAEVLHSGDEWTVADCVRLQTDHVSLPARSILTVLSGLDSEDRRLADALEMLRSWDAKLSPDSGAGALFEIWFRRHLRPALLRAALSRLVPADQVGRALARVLPAEDAAADPRVDLQLLLEPGDRLGPDPSGTLREILLGTLADAVRETEGLLGEDPGEWRWGTLHRSLLRHPLTGLGLLGERGKGEPEWATVGPAPRGGSGDTVGAAAYTSDFRQSGGATFRLVVDVGDWDRSVAMNSPGQSGNPSSPHHHDLFSRWADDEAFPLLYSRAAVEEHTARRLLLRPSPEQEPRPGSGPASRS
ncbi:penicillin acylase family protein [Streptomyces albidus (ex Kaewkla and Franco 2022)]|uniref:penicillin acylase family protein n=1 Tax=Streptomyces albidus (ex Kaewkla and Franco 2022) TaxID=722709 RepID=UPI0015EEA245|nr:penicillin acylase family protein [Streptomyces albidus (ex Kaewkla and Franco 2022)]